MRCRRLNRRSASRRIFGSLAPNFKISIGHHASLEAIGTAVLEWRRGYQKGVRESIAYRERKTRETRGCSNRNRRPPTGKQPTKEKPVMSVVNIVRRFVHPGEEQSPHLRASAPGSTPPPGPPGERPTPRGRGHSAQRRSRRRHVGRARARAQAAAAARRGGAGPRA